ncbi:unnamed protein product, partial [marine sediment metagenome]
LGTVIGDIVGYPYEFNNIKTKDFELFTEKSQFSDDTVLTVALAHSILDDKPYEGYLERYGKKYPHAGYGGNFVKWIWLANKKPYNSWGNGSAMRVSPIAWAYDDEITVMEKAKESAECTHNHPEGIKGAQAIALAIYMARVGGQKKDIKGTIEDLFDYDINESCDSLRKWYKFDVSCKGTVPPAIRCFLESNNFEQAIRLAVSIGGDSDTLAAITGSIAEAYYGGIPKEILVKIVNLLDDDLLDVIRRFRSKFIKGREWE